MSDNRSIPERFWPKVKKGDGCWEWQAMSNEWGYGIIKINNVFHRAHRISWELENGPIPEGMFICHKCDNPLCVRPEHLFLGTHNDNMADCKRKGRHAHGDRHRARLYPDKNPRGETHGQAKLTQSQVDEIRAAYAAGAKQKELGEKYGLKQPSISDIIRRRNWRQK